MDYGIILTVVLEPLQQETSDRHVEYDSRGRGCDTCYPEAVNRAHWRAV